jgi:hypothetical protein
MRPVPRLRSLPMAALLAASWLSLGCPKLVTVPPPGTDTQRPAIGGVVDTRTSGRPSLSAGAVIFVNPVVPGGGFVIEATATDPGGVKWIALDDCFDCPTRQRLRIVNAAAPVDSLFLLYELHVQPGERHKIGITAQDYSGNPAEIGPVTVAAAAVPTDVFPAATQGAQSPVGVRTVKGTIYAAPHGKVGNGSYNADDPDYHYFFVPDEQDASIADTLGTDTFAFNPADGLGNLASGGVVAPEQDGWVSDFNAAAPGIHSQGKLQYWRDRLAHEPNPAGWSSFTEAGSAGVIWPFDPKKDTFGSPLQAGDHIEISGRLLYDHDEDVMRCWNEGSTAAPLAAKSAQQGHHQGHAEIHPINYIQKIAPLPGDAKTVVWLSACAKSYVAIETSENVTYLDQRLTPMAPRPPGYVASIKEEIDGPFTVCRRVSQHSLLRLGAEPENINVHVKVEGESGGRSGGKFRAKYTLWWSPPGQAVIQPDPTGCVQTVTSPTP